jgi:hypothetical protein
MSIYPYRIDNSMRKLAEQLKKIDIELPKWTREVLFEHLVEICKDIKQQEDLKKA